MLLQRAAAVATDAAWAQVACVLFIIHGNLPLRALCCASKSGGERFMIGFQVIGVACLCAVHSIVGGLAEGG